MKKLFTIAFCCLIAMKCLAVKDYYVSPTGDDSHTGSSRIDANALKTLEGVQIKMAALYGTTVTEPVNIYLVGNIATKANSYPYEFTWSVSGTSSYPITITSIAGDNTTYSISRPAGDAAKNGYMITLDSVNYITIDNVKFNDATVGIYLLKSNHCTIKNCEFICTTIYSGGGAGTITLSNSRGAQIPLTQPECNYNTIRNNKIDAQGEGMIPGNDSYICGGYKPKSISYHGIYIGRAANNEVSYNQINNPAGGGIHCFHGYTQDNQISENVINVCYNDYDDGYYSLGKEAIILGYGEGAASDISDNIIERNYCAGNLASSYSPYPCVSYTPRYVSANSYRDLLVDSAVDAISSHNGNQYDNNYFHYDASRFVVDPFWVQYNSSLVTNRMVSGDFDGDGKKDDIAAFHGTGSGTSTIHVWLNNGEKLFEFYGTYPWWSGTYDVTKITARFVSGDFNGDGYDDLAALYNSGSSNCHIDVWTSNGSSFSMASPAWWTANTNSYDATKVSGRFVSGDFNNDGYDDIAAMYDYGSSNSSIHVWTSGGSSFSPSGYAYTWWTVSSNSYDATKVTNRFVSGDFNDDGYDDIAALYDYGSSNSSLHVWLYSSSTFIPNGSAYTWWTANSNSYDATKVSNRFVCGDFDADGYKDDIAAMYDYGSSNAHLHSWTSGGSSFSPSGYANDWWTSNSGAYPVSKVSGRMLAGDFNNGGKWDIAAMYDYSFNTSFYRTRFHVWECSGSSFDIQNNSLGYPWTDLASTLGITCADEDEPGKKAWDSVQPNKPAAQAIMEEPRDYSFAAYPNPASAELTIEYVLPKSSKVGVQLYNVYGQKVMSLVEENILAGRYSKKVDVSSLQSGVYTLKYLVEGNPVQTRKLIIQ